jgi:lipopolysaccharide export system protein LptA
MNKRPLRTWCRRTALFGALFCAASAAATAQTEKIIHLEHADSLKGVVINGEQARELVGNVKFTQGTMTVTCRRAIQYLTSNTIEVQGEAEMWDGTMRMVSERGVYHGDTRVAEAFDRVMLEDSATTLKARYGRYFANEKRAYFRDDVSVEDSASVLTAGEMTYFREAQHLIADSNVIIHRSRSGLTITGRHFESFRKKKFSTMTGSPRVVQIDTAGTGKHDTLVVTSRLMESYQDTLERLVAIDSVRLTRGEVSAEAGSAVFMTALDSMELRRAPVVWYATGPGEENQVSGDSIFIKLLQRKLHMVHVRGDAFAVSRADSVLAKRFNQMSGQEITMAFAEDRVQRITVDKTATSLYYLLDKGTPNGMNKTTGDRVVLTFSEGKIDKIKVYGGVEGQYYPEKMIRNREEEYNLTGFRWREQKAP